MANQRDAASRFNLHSINLEGLTADPTDAKVGDIWYRSDADVFKCKTAVGVKTITVA